MKTVGSLGRFVPIIFTGCILLACGLLTTSESATVSGQRCLYVGPSNRDAAGFIDSCKGTTKTACEAAASGWNACKVWVLPNGYFCFDCSGSCSCEQGAPLTVTTYYGEGSEPSDPYGCQWGQGNPQNPVPGGECFCLFDASTQRTETVYRCR